MTDDTSDLAEILARVARGDDHAVRVLIETKTHLVLSICRSHWPRLLSVEDLAQEVFVTMFARLDSYQARSGAPFTAWLSRLAMNVCLDALRAERCRLRLIPRAEASGVV